MRKSLLAKLHIARKELALDEDAYRAVLETVTGQRSAANLTDAQIGQVLEHFKKCGWQSKKFGKRPEVLPSRKELLGKIEALLADAGRHWNYAHGCASKMFQVERLEWCDDIQLRKIVAALEYDAKRRAAREKKAKEARHAT